VVKGRERAATLDDVRLVDVERPGEPVGADDEPEGVKPASQPPTAVISWAHGDDGWQVTIAELAFRLRDLGIEVDVDLWHLHDPSVNWSTRGPQAIQEREFVPIPVSAAYRERWEGKRRGEPVLAQLARPTPDTHGGVGLRLALPLSPW
jgi:hypothetical protein